jgi:hypothetical protein
LHLPQPISNRPQQKLAPIFVNNRDTMYAAGFSDARATLLRLPTAATNPAMLFGEFAP